MSHPAINSIRQNISPGILATFAHSVNICAPPLSAASKYAAEIEASYFRARICSASISPATDGKRRAPFNDELLARAVYLDVIEKKCRDMALRCIVAQRRILMGFFD